LSEVQGLLRPSHEKERDWGQLYLDYQPVTPRDRLLVEDLAVAMLKVAPPVPMLTRS
jgi:hypothetical protein